jgi:hypothetical protein
MLVLGLVLVLVLVLVLGLVMQPLPPVCGGHAQLA